MLGSFSAVCGGRGRTVSTYGVGRVVSCEDATQIAVHVAADSVQVALEQEVPSVDEMDLRVREVASEGVRPGGGEDLIVAPPHREQGHL